MVAVRTMGEVAHGRQPLVVQAQDTVLEAARQMVAAGKAAVLVMEQARVVGIFTEHDLLNRVMTEGRDPRTVQVSEVMTSPVVTVRPDLSYQEGLRRMEEADVRYLVLMDGDQLVGMVSRRDLMANDIEVVEEMLRRIEPAALFI